MHQYPVSMSAISDHFLQQFTLGTYSYLGLQTALWLCGRTKHTVDKGGTWRLNSAPALLQAQVPA